MSSHGLWQKSSFCVTNLLHLLLVWQSKTVLCPMSGRPIKMNELIDVRFTPVDPSLARVALLTRQVSISTPPCFSHHAKCSLLKAHTHFLFQDFYKLFVLVFVPVLDKGRQRALFPDSYLSFRKFQFGDLTPVFFFIPPSSVSTI